MPSATVAGIAESDDTTTVLGERIGLHRFPGPGAGLIDAIGNVDRAHCAFLRWGQAISQVCRGSYALHGEPPLSGTRNDIDRLVYALTRPRILHRSSTALDEQ